MSLHMVHFFGKRLGMENSFYALVPDADGPFSVLYLLHGLSDDCSGWLRRTAVDCYASGHKLIVVMPSAGQSWYVNDRRVGGLAYEDHIVGDLVEYVDRTFHTRPSRGNRAIAGLSMGGFGAVMLALKHPKLFSVACSHSGAFYTGPLPSADANRRQIIDQIVKPEGDVFELARAFSPLQNPPAATARKPRKGRSKAKAAAAKELESEPVDSLIDLTPHLYIDCGTEDYLIEHNRSFHAHLDALQVVHRYQEFGGAHDWTYWNDHLRDSLAFVLEHLESTETTTTTA